MPDVAGVELGVVEARDPFEWSRTIRGQTQLLGELRGGIGFDVEALDEVWNISAIDQMGEVVDILQSLGRVLRLLDKARPVAGGGGERRGAEVVFHLQAGQLEGVIVRLRLVIGLIEREPARVLLKRVITILFDTLIHQGARDRQAVGGLHEQD